MAGRPMIEIEGLHKRFGQVHAVRGGTPHHLSSVKRRVCKPAVIKRL